MSDTLDLWPKLVIASLATWRLTHLLAREDGPFLSIARVRRVAGTSVFGQMLDCFNCLSLWVAAPIAVWSGVGAWQIIMIWLALSGAACLCERLGQSAWDQSTWAMRALPEDEPNQGDRT